MHNTEMSAEQLGMMPDQVLAILEFHFRYGVGRPQNARDLTGHVGTLPVSLRTLIEGAPAAGTHAAHRS